jgi:SAM-dependent methyltransferase
MELSVRPALAQRSRAARLRMRDYLLGAEPDRITVREDIARAYLRGSGIEIGALNVPLRIPPSVRVTYVDYLPIETLRVHHAHLVAEGGTLTAPDIVDDGEKLVKFEDASMDFVVANHFIEHSEDPIGTIQAHLRVIRAGGRLFMAVPDKRWTFDVEREITPLEHLIRDHEEGPDWSRERHYGEWARFVDKVPEDQVDQHAADVAARRFSIHFHVFTPQSYLEMLVHCMSSGVPFELEHFQQTESEFVTVLRKTG